MKNKLKETLKTILAGVVIGGMFIVLFILYTFEIGIPIFNF